MLECWWPNLGVSGPKDGIWFNILRRRRCYHSSTDLARYPHGESHGPKPLNVISVARFPTVALNYGHQVNGHSLSSSPLESRDRGKALAGLGIEADMVWDPRDPAQKFLVVGHGRIIEEPVRLSHCPCIDRASADCIGAREKPCAR